MSLFRQFRIKSALRMWCQRISKGIKHKWNSLHKQFPFTCFLPVTGSQRFILLLVQYTFKASSLTCVWVHESDIQQNVGMKTGHDWRPSHEHLHQISIYRDVMQILMTITQFLSPSHTHTHTHCPANPISIDSNPENIILYSPSFL